MIKEKLTYKNKRAAKKLLQRQWANGILLAIIIATTAASAFYAGFVASPNPTQPQQNGYTSPPPAPQLAEPQITKSEGDTTETEITKTADNFSVLEFGEIIGIDQVVRVDFSGWNITSQSTVAGYECRLNEQQWETCESPKILTDLQSGEYTFEVRGVDQSGNADTTPAVFMWTVR